MKELKTLSHQRCRVKVFESVEDLEEIRGFWENMQWHPYTHIDYFILSAQIEPDFIRPYVVVLYEEDTPDVLFIGRIIEKTFQWKIGYMRIGKTRARCLEIVYGGILGRVSEQQCHVMLEALFARLKHGEADLIFFDFLRIDSPLYAMIKGWPNVFYRDLIAEYVPHVKFILPESFDTYLQNISKNARGNIRKSLTRMNKAYGDDIFIRCFTEKADVDRAMDDIEHVAAETYQRRMGVGFWYDEDTRRKWQLLAELGILRAYILYIEERPCAFWTVYDYKNVHYTIETGYDVSMRDYRPGLFLLVDIVKKLIDDPQAEAVDYGFGEAFYKRILGNESWLESRINLYAPTWKGQWIKIVKNTTTGISRIASRMLHKFQAFGFVRRVWRRRLSAK